MAKKFHRDRKLEAVTFVASPYNLAFSKNLVSLLKLDFCPKELSSLLSGAWNNYQTFKEIQDKTPTNSESKKIFQDISTVSINLYDLLDKLNIDEELELTNNNSLNYSTYESIKENLELLSHIASNKSDLIRASSSGRPPTQLSYKYLIVNLLKIFELINPEGKRFQKRFIHECLQPLRFYTPYKDDISNDTLDKLITNSKKLI